MTAGVEKTPKVGILLTTYNLGPYLEDAIQSLKKQTFQDFMVHVVDDCSTDNITQTIVRDLKYDKISEKIIEKKNIGLNNITIKHLPELRSEYIMIFCADDILKPQYLEKTVAFLDAHKDTAAVATWLHYFQDGKGYRKYDEKKCILPDMIVENHFLGSSLVRRSAMEEFGWSSSDPRCLHQDHHRWVSILENGHRLGVVKEPLFKYRILHNSMSHGASEQRETEFKDFFIEQHHQSIMKYGDFIAKSLWYKNIENHDKYKEAQAGHEWLDMEYKKLVKQVEELSAQNTAMDLKLQKIEANPVFRTVLALRRFIKH